MYLFSRDTGLMLLIAACAVLVVLPLQIGLCFKAKKQLVKCLPAAVLAVTTITFYIMAITAKTWDAFAYLIAAFFSGVFLVSCGIAWGIWAIINAFIRRRKRTPAPARKQE